MSQDSAAVLSFAGFLVLIL